MKEQELGGNIRLVNFNFDAQEMVLIKKLIGNYAKKIRTVREYQELKIEIRDHSRDKVKKFEISALLILDGEKASANAEGFNPFVLLDEVLERVLNEVKHRPKEQK
jgi:hypothetical protein